MDSCDVLIVGGGPAGSSCAWGLRRSGLDVAILDKQIFPRNKVCGGWITPRVLTSLEIDSGEYAHQRTLQPITAFKVGRIGGPVVETHFGTSVSYGIRRLEFDDYLLKRSGSRVLPAAALASLEGSEKGWIANGEIRANLVVGAGGHFCPVARLVRAKATSAETPVVAQEIEFEMDTRQLALCGVRGDTPELYFCSDMRGYGWCFRKGTFLNVGLGRADPHRLSEHVADFLKFLKSDGLVSFDVPPLRGHAYLLRGTSTRRIVGEGFLLIGDAAGLAYPQSGEGILPAIESGLVAARTIVAAKGQYSRAQLESYRAVIAGWKHPWGGAMSQNFPSTLISSAAGRLLKSHWFSREVVLKKWFLHHAAERLGLSHSA
jgi:menaquinone-9 beta-reductase